MRKVSSIIIHHSESDIKSHDDISVIKEWHLDRGFKDVGYHYFIRKNGSIQKGRDSNIIGAHCKKKNRSSIGICLSGDSKFTEYQFRALAVLIRRIKDIYGKLAVQPHSKYSEKDCPNFDVDKFKEDYL